MCSSESPLIFLENRGAFASTRKYIFTSDDADCKVIDVNDGDKDKKKDASSSSWTQVSKVALRQVFLPHGYPQSVSKDYVPYQCWDTIQAFSSSITGSIATEAVMKGVGVGNEAATPLAAALTWLLKSGSGHVGQIVFAWSKGTSLDHDCKKWRLFADGLNDIATFIDLIAPIFPINLVVYVLCSASVARALVGVAGSATRSAVTQHQARQNNMGDVSAKDGSQETLVNLLALIVSLLLLPLISGNLIAVWSLYIIFTSIHLFANYKAVKSLEIESLNRPRLLLALEDYITSGRVSTIKRINARESVILGRGLKDEDVCGMKIRLGVVPLESALVGISSRKRSGLEKYLSQSSSAPFIIIPDGRSKLMNVILHENIQPVEILEAFCRSTLLGVVLNKQYQNFDYSSMKNKAGGDLEELGPMDEIISKEWKNFKKMAESQGFIFSQAPLDSGEWRAKWLHS